jgi:hypothetical protein
VISQTFGIQRLNNVNGVHKRLFIKRPVEDVFVQQVTLIYQMDRALNASHPNIGIINKKSA